jgi:hypothetical protein
MFITDIARNSHNVIGTHYRLGKKKLLPRCCEVFSVACGEHQPEAGPTKFVGDCKTKAA